jgi:predicted nucleotidyltransferase
MDDKLNEIIDRIVMVADPDMILLFGSRASGDERDDSDYDILIIKSDLDNSRKLAKKIYNSLSGIGVPVDLVIVDKERMNQHLDDPYMIYGEALREGKTLYAKA